MCDKKKTLTTKHNDEIKTSRSSWPYGDKKCICMEWKNWSMWICKLTSFLTLFCWWIFISFEQSLCNKSNKQIGHLIKFTPYLFCPPKIITGNYFLPVNNWLLSIRAIISISFLIRKEKTQRIRKRWLLIFLLSLWVTSMLFMFCRITKKKRNKN